MWTAIAVHATLAAGGVDPWRAALVAEVLWVAREEPRLVAPARSTPGITAAASVEGAIRLALRLARLVHEAIGLEVRIKAAGTTDSGEAWATFVDPRNGAVTSVPVSEDARALVAIATLLRGA